MTLTNQQIERIMKFIIKRDIFEHIDITRLSFNKIQKIAYGLGFIEANYYEITHNHILTTEDYLKCIEKIWEYITSGILSPGKDLEHSWFPSVHLTEKGNNFKESIRNEEIELINDIKLW